TPSTTQVPIRVIAAGDTLVLLTAHTSNDFLRVRSGSDTGWVFSALVEIVITPPTVPPVTPPPVTPPSVAPPPVTSAPQNYHGCPLLGNAVQPAVKSLNVLKNRFIAPTDAELDSTVTLEAMLAPGADDHRFTEQKGAIIEGVVLAVKVGGIETVNCKTTDPVFRDTHIELGIGPGVPATRRVIVEVTPRWRAAMQAAGLTWTTAGLQSLVGKRVRFRGWLMFDIEHRDASENTAPGHAGNWRATAWELHPITWLTTVSP
ncbi:MAG: hypothetical protein M3081_20095, partial [Gemmatimonadota bacterium]|nr:hypothetical protein [Gemmatimonadota bacterium]